MKWFAFVYAAILLAPPANAQTINMSFQPDDDRQVVSLVVHALQELSFIPEMQDVTVGSKHLPLDVYAEAGDGEIMLNSVYTSHKALNNMMASDVAQGFHPPLGRCSAEEFLTFHESAHVIDGRKGHRPSSELSKKYGPGRGLPLSGYSFSGGELSPREALAESFASVLCSGGNSVERDIYGMVVN